MIVATHFLLVGDETDIPLLRRLLEQLPVNAYGQAFIELTTPALPTSLDAPEGLTVTWLPPSVREPFSRRGDAAASAALAWVAEWLPDETCTHDAPYVMWIGCSTSNVMDRLRGELGDRLERLHLHHR